MLDCGSIRYGQRFEMIEDASAFLKAGRLSPFLKLSAPFDTAPLRESRQAGTADEAGLTAREEGVSCLIIAFSETFHAEKWDAGGELLNAEVRGRKRGITSESMR